MADAGSTPFYFHSDALPGESVEVTKVQGTEKISAPYEFKIDLVSDDPEIDLESVLGARASLCQVRQTGEEAVTHGILNVFEQLQAIDVADESGTRKVYRYRAVLVPELWLLSLRIDNKIHQNLDIKGIIQQELQEAGYPSDRVEYRLSRSYPKQEYVVQYRESDLNFLSRLMEHEGIFYFFEQQEHTEMLVITDSNPEVEDANDNAIPYRAQSGQFSSEETVNRFDCSQKRVPRQVVLKDYNYRKPGLPLKTSKQAADEDGSKQYEYGNHFKTNDEGQTLAGIRAEEIKAGQRIFSGESDCPALRPGFMFSLTDHYRPDFNQGYVITQVIHNGRQAIAFVDGQRVDDAENNEGQVMGYYNEFLAISSDVPFRPERKTEKPRLYGVMNAHVDSATDGKYADIDDQGRYKLVMPFDLSGKKDGNASRYMRMAQPYVGEEYGMHFPLHKDVEVIWTCIDGDLDRPIICGAVPHPNKASPVTQKNQTRSVIRSASRNEIALEDKDKAELVYVHAVRDMKSEIDNDESRNVKRTRTTTIGVDDTKKVGQDENANIHRHRTVHIDKGHDTLQVHEGNQAYTVSLGNATLDVSAGNRTVKVAKTYEVTAQNIKLTASNSIEIVCGGGSIKLDASGNISINGVNLKSIASAINDIKGSLVKINT